MKKQAAVAACEPPSYELSAPPSYLAASLPSCQLSSLLVPCPFDGCSQRLLDRDLEVHTFSCPFRLKYGFFGDADEKSVVNEPEILRRVHAVNAHDTLAAIASHYDTSVEELIRLNRSQGLSRFNLKMLDYVAVPGTPNEADLHTLDAIKRNYKVKTFMRKSKCAGGPSEAVSYLYMSNYDLHKALAQYREDTQWEHSRDPHE